MEIYIIIRFVGVFLSLLSLILGLIFSHYIFFGFNLLMLISSRYLIYANSRLVPKNRSSFSDYELSVFSKYATSIVELF